MRQKTNYILYYYTLQNYYDIIFKGDNMKLVPAKCPSCGANIEVDRSLKFTKCQYCGTEIIVEEAVENLLKVELKDSPTLENYLKLGNRYFENSEYEEAYKIYCKAEEIDPDNPIVVLRRGLCRTMIVDYNHFDVASAINGLKTSYDLMKKMKMAKEEITLSITETGTVLFAVYQYIVDVYQRNKFNKEQTKGYIERLEALLKGYEYLDTIVNNNQELKDRILSSMIIIIDTILGNSNNSKYQLSSSYINDLNNQKKDYMNRRTKEMIQPSFSKKEKVVSIQNKTSIIWDILCYMMIFILLIMLLGSIFNGESILNILLWLLAIISFIPQLKRSLIKKYGYNMHRIVIITRVILIILLFIILASGPVEFENTFKGEDGTKITLKDGKISIVTGDTEIQGTYHWETKDNDYYIHVKGKNVDEDIEYRYRSNEDGGSLCLLESNQCTTIYQPIN